MTLKKLLPIASIVMLMAFSLPASSAIIVPASSSTNGTPKTEDPRAQQLLNRLEVIKGMNKSELTKTEKKDLRKEVKGIRKEMRHISGGVYLSAGAIIIIILVLILVL